MHKFEIGDRVRVNCPDSLAHGEETTVISGLREDYDPAEARPYIGYGVDVPIEGREQTATFEPHELIPIYDGNELVSWEDVIWQPPAGVMG